MNPKDKDFVTRFQLSQIVTEDPYNEDFYAQVFKVIHPKQLMVFNNLLNKTILLLKHTWTIVVIDWGRYKRADVALQRMQQQVQKQLLLLKKDRS